MTGWLVIASTVPAISFAVAPVNCRRFESGRGSRITPGAGAFIALGVGTAIAIVGSVLRARRMRNVPRTTLLERQALFRAPWARGVGLTALVVGTTFATSYGTVLRIGGQCLD
ncbi:MAG: hypothetical protein R3B40_26475 [Polyangiales bacterium]|nr:hypothetical protein [Myxococcales bacterium]MCB9661534.1 hypothetical protein [Sandaracinaceae bacterium]